MLENATTVENTPVYRWAMDGVEMAEQGASLDVSSESKEKELLLLGGNVKRLTATYGETPRTEGMYVIRADFPRIGRPFYDRLRYLLEFGVTFRLAVKVVDPDEPVLLRRDIWDGYECAGRPLFYFPHRSFLTETVRIYEKDLTERYPKWRPVPESAYDTPDEVTGSVRFRYFVAETTLLGATYEWAPSVKVQEVTAQDVSGSETLSWTPSVVFREVKPSGTPATIAPAPLPVVLHRQAYLPFDSDLLDHSARSVTAINAGATNVIGQVAGAAYFSGSASISLANVDVSEANASNRLTLSAWIRNSATKYPDGKRVAVSESNGLFLGVTQDGHVTVSVPASVAAVTATSARTVAKNTWAHVAVVWAGCRLTIYINGVKDSSADFTPRLLSVSGSWNVGKSASGDAFWQGRIDEVSIYDTEIAADDIRRLMLGWPPIGDPYEETQELRNVVAATITPGTRTVTADVTCCPVPATAKVIGFSSRGNLNPLLITVSEDRLSISYEFPAADEPLTSDDWVVFAY